MSYTIPQDSAKKQANYKGKRVSVIGFGRSGKACVKLLLDMGVKVFVSELMDEVSSPSLLSTFPGVEFEFGKHSEKILASDMIIISPGVPLSHPILSKARQIGIPVVGELEFASQFVKNPIIGITGTNGKTTTAFLIHEVLKVAGIDTLMCGNLGVPLSSVIGRDLINQTPTIPVIVEVSTFQLESINSFHPWIGVLLNITPDHLDRHESFKEYRELKLRLFSNQTTKDFAVLNFDDPEVRQISVKSQKLFFSACRGLINQTPTVWINNGNILWHSDMLFSVSDLNLKWECLLDDYLATIVVAKILDISRDSILNGLQSFKCVPHRLEDIGIVRGVRFINNSMCTNPASFVKTLSSFTTNLVIIAGGKLKGTDITFIAKSINEKVKHAVLIGESSKELCKLLKVEYSHANSMDEAVKLAFSHASPGDVVLLSPGFASFDWFTNFRDRGEKFKQAVKAL
ncbi:MAG: UDP-N-acetylmuramoyl-L-alanine--D-glutamate ligase [bacterium]|nr:UDP-N-acetylmuramoyl-L-alanine--D-glutamate ligase [bacterium]